MKSIKEKLNEHLINEKHGALIGYQKELMEEAGVPDFVIAKLDSSPLGEKYVTIDAFVSAICAIYREKNNK